MYAQLQPSTDHLTVEHFHSSLVETNTPENTTDDRRMLVSDRGSSVATNSIHVGRSLLYALVASGERRRRGTLGLF